MNRMAASLAEAMPLKRLRPFVHKARVKTPLQPQLPLLMDPLPASPATVAPPTICWRRSARARRISLRIDARLGQVVITLPKRAAKSAGMALLNDHAAWVAARLAALPDKVRFEPGASVTIDGTPHVIRHAQGGRGGAWIEDGAVHVSGAPEFMARRVNDFLRAEARRRFAVQALAKARLAGVVPRRVVVKDTRTRWGSCSPDGVLMFCWRLVMAPPFVQDYVVAHEVAHLRHLNHGAQFWTLCESLSRDRARAEAWLHSEGAGLLRTG
jgi:predicted metal-dependent hydrolase